jgi:hypothetical protein
MADRTGVRVRAGGRCGKCCCAPIRLECSGTGERARSYKSGLRFGRRWHDVAGDAVASHLARERL